MEESQLVSCFWCKVLPVVKQFARGVSTTLVTILAAGRFISSFRRKVRAVATDRWIDSFIVIGSVTGTRISAVSKQCGSAAHYQGSWLGAGGFVHITCVLKIIHTWGRPPTICT